jgi:protein tyrosine/serine phosphatase
MTTPRDIDLADVYNLRDLGGYRTADGRRTRWRRLFRGAGLHRLAGADLAQVGELGLRTVIDLRTAEEIAAVGGYPAAGVDAHHLPMITGQWDHSTIDESAPPERYLVQRYVEMLEVGRPAIATSFALLAEPGALPAVFYCAAGKDRTGVLAALILDAIGVGEDEIVADYHRSKAQVERIVARARAAGAAEADSPMLSQPAAVMAAPPEAMALLLAALRARHGSAAGYLHEIGVDAETIGAVAANLLEPDPDRAAVARL